MSEFIRTEHLSYTYEDDSGLANEVLKDVSLTINSGEYIAVLGHNGSGKSTFAKLLNMILFPTSGKIYVEGKDISGDDADEDLIFETRKKIGMVFQNPDNQLVATIVEEDVAFGPENLGVKSSEIRQRVDMALSEVGMSEYAKYAPHRLSGGQKQRVAIAGILAMMPKCIIFDEATAMLDPLGRRDVIAIMEKLNREKNITVLNITHHMDEAVRADRIIVINDGVVSIDGIGEEVFSNMEKLREVGLEAPQPTELLHELNLLGEDMPIPCLDIDECVNVILKKYDSI